MPRGRPSTYTEELAEDICLQVSTTPKMLEDLCEENEHWPSANCIYEWRIKYPDFGERYTRAKQCQIEPLVSQILLLARNEAKDFIENDDGSLIPNTPAMTRRRLEIDAIKWFAAKLAPKIYGERKIKDDEDKEDFISKHRDEL